MEIKSGLVKNVTTRNVKLLEDDFNRVWAFISTQTGDVIFIEVATGKVFSYNLVGVGNIYTKAMAIKGHDYLMAYDTALGIPVAFIDGEYGELKLIDMDSEMNSYPNYGKASSAQSIGSISGYHPSSDDKVYLNTYRYRDAFGTTVIDPTDWSITRLNMQPLPDYTHAQARWDIKCTKVTSSTHSSLDGVYVDWPYDDSDPPVWFIPTLETEIGTTAFSYTSGHIMLHWEDRSSSSLTRRVIAKLDGTVKVVDLKNTSTYLSSNQTASIHFYDNLPGSTWEDETATSRTPTIENNTFPTYASELSESAPTLDASIHYGYQFVYGSFLYSGFSYIGSKNYFQVYVKDPATGDVVWIDSYDPYTDFANNGDNITFAKVDFGQVKYGYTTGTHEIAFIQRRSGESLVWGFIRLDNNNFEDYDYLTNPNGYTINTISLNNPDDSDYWYSFRTNSSSDLETLSDEKEYYVQTKASGTETSRVQAAIGSDFEVEVDGESETGSLYINVLDDYTDPERVYQVKVPNLLTTNGTLGYVIQTAANKVFVAGIDYAGIIEYSFTSPNTWEIENTFGKFVSMRGAKRVSSDYVLFHGYLGSTDLLNVSTSVKTTILTPEMGRANDASKFDDTYAIIAGGLIRNNDYNGNVNGRTGIIKLSTLTYVDFPDLPTDFDYQRITSTRSTVGLTADTYTQAEADAICDQYELDTGSSRANTITLLKSLGDSAITSICSYTHSSNIRIVWAMKYIGWIGFRNLELSDGASGVVTAYDDAALYYPKLRVYTGGANLETSVASDFKEVSVEAVPQGQTTVGRCFATDNYVFFTLNYNDGFEESYVATAGQTEFNFSVVDAKQITSEDIIEVRKNTVLLTEGADWTRDKVANGIDLTSGATLSDGIEIKVFDRASLYACSVTDFETAVTSGTLSSFTKSLHIKLDCFSDDSYGWGVGGENSSSSKGQDFVDTSGDKVFISIKHPLNGYVPVVYRVDLTASTLSATTLITSDTDTTIVLSYYLTGDRLWLGFGNSVSYLDTALTVSSSVQLE